MFVGDKKLTSNGQAKDVCVQTRVTRPTNMFNEHGSFNIKWSYLLEIIPWDSSYSPVTMVKWFGKVLDMNASRTHFARTPPFTNLGEKELGEKYICQCKIFVIKLRVRIKFDRQFENNLSAGQVEDNL